MATVDDLRDLHHGSEILMMPNAWDVGSAKILAHLGFRAVATTSSGSAAARGKLDGGLDRDTVLTHVRELAEAVDVPVSADLERCFADAPEGVADTIRAARATGAAGASVEDWSGDAIYDAALAAERVAAAVEAAAGTLVITARAENHIHGIDDLRDTIARLQSFQQSGADVLFAPGIRTREQIAAVVGSVDVPVSVLVRPGMMPVAELAALGVRRVSVGGAFAFNAYAALADAAGELLSAGTYGFAEGAGRGSGLARQAFG
ncbi:isocitrate lyase/phosphoenolpyruvate mutase family protein [Rhodococcus sp. D2-41]|uniref:isocitrate lyase/PEP mutase family protein n=1 Tax=Speluncibacter jeojiensis TaxID=2710754 RepID=UPI00240FBC7C|nr:isocitrate lyase/phosphoenolpyruvate mutase family protein [Rhodococcus sp. D2-41]MDG3011428.1 isocitrate lyase/phosphoenolpyruvate mutase family protein [Rhodococcus sp. D2-41]